MIIRSSQHSLKFANTAKKERYSAFLAEYRRMAVLMVDHLWEHGYGTSFAPKDEKWELPKYLDYKLLPEPTTLSARAMSSLATQIRGVLDAAVEKHKARLSVRDRLASEGKPVPVKLQEKIDRFRPVKPDASNVNPELSSKCCVFHPVPSPLFEGVLVLQSIGQDFGKIVVPLKGTKVGEKWSNQGATRLGSFLLMDRVANVRWKLDRMSSGATKKVGADQGLKAVLTLSDGQRTPDSCIHGHTLDSILEKLSRKRKGSKAFRSAQAHRDNFIRWSINRLDLSGVGELALERIWNIRYRSRTSRKMSHWCNPLIRDKCKARCEECGVRVSEQSSVYRSQRCHQCGLVLKSNRSGRIYSCENCGYVGDSDLNAAKNHELDLPDVPDWLKSGKFNRTGFYWLECGFYERNGEERGVPLCRNEVTVVDH